MESIQPPTTPPPEQAAAEPDDPIGPPVPVSRCRHAARTLALTGYVTGISVAALIMPTTPTPPWMAQ